ncbi:hypothetical protein TCA2_3256 [Paenibacillus sp. TCA20]|uniref:ThuA domain-containing protein n=1 Tax=Paenibacillus urinalis TaxID=521520 RepID=A0AAX3MSR2_9BACL|nr:MULTISPECIES: ThuA domain-containing protein [Paenibacillus]WDH80570.1 ThuA domain-containing protein [Paenibacillus urinalis]GAK40766.1 hypothetical protein TCA2_3256 [Paenibacillus sp. TCA20]
MNKRINALLIGDNGVDVWHPLEPARQQLVQIIGESTNLTVTEDYDSLKELSRDEFDVVISYTDCWLRDLTTEQTAGLITFVAGGGGILVIHNGISLQRSSELAQMIGAKFITHPPYQILSYHGIEPTHPLLEGVPDFVMGEEPYVVEFDPFAPVKVFLEYEYQGRRYPAAWENGFGLSKIIYLQPGHDARSFEPEPFRQLIRNSVVYAAGCRPVTTAT